MPRLPTSSFDMPLSSTEPEQLRALHQALTANARLADATLSLASHRFWLDQLATEHYADPRKLTRHGRRVYSQNDEDGLLQEIFARIGTTDRRFVEFGVETGVECNTAKLLVEGWSGLWIEGDAQHAARAQRTLAGFVREGRLQVKQAFVTAENINGLILSAGIAGEIDLLSVDIDGNDYWVWRAIEAIAPRVVVIEYNATLPPPLSFVTPYAADFRWDGSNFYGASLEALVRLGKARGYQLVGCNFVGVNAFFVRADLCADKFYLPATAEALYEPPRLFLRLANNHHGRPGVMTAV